MGWFSKLCRNVGLMVHNVKHPDDSGDKQVLRKDVSEAKSKDITLRRTTIDEVEIKAEQRESDDDRPADGAS